MAADESQRLLAGRYQLGAVIGRGGMGTVWKARDELLNRNVAVKEIVWPPQLDPAERELARRRAVREAQLAARLHHPNVVAIYDIVEEDDRPCIVMELVPFRSLRDMVQANPALHGMGTTLTALVWSGAQLGLAHIGDSRAYLVRDGAVFQITQDHTLVQSLLDEGTITAEEAVSHPQRLLLLRALTGDHASRPDIQLRQARSGDRYLLCSDGLHVAAPTDAIARVLLTVPDPDQATAALIALAMDGGAPDNITCIVADVTAQPAPAPRPTASVTTNAVGPAVTLNAARASVAPGAM